MLYALEVPRERGDTLFCNMYSAYESLSATLRDFFNGLHARHSYFGNSAAGRERDSGYRAGHNGDHTPAAVVHPLVRTHPATGRRALSVNPHVHREHHRDDPTRERCAAALPLRA